MSLDACAGICSVPRVVPVHVTEFGYTAAEHATVVSEVIRRLDLRDLIVMGHDWGGPTGLSAAADNADRVSGLVLGNTAFWPPDRGARLFSRVMSTGFMQRRLADKRVLVTYPMSDRAFPAKTTLPRFRATFEDIQIVELPGTKHFFLEDQSPRAAEAIRSRFTPHS
ncbi:alpha/beta fold hydrolase [Amycolatopsis lurida]